MIRQILRAIARRCEVHDVATWRKTTELELALGYPPSSPARNFIEQFSDPDLINCGHEWCRRRRGFA